MFEDSTSWRCARSPMACWKKLKSAESLSTMPDTRSIEDDGIIGGVRQAQSAK
jgi:hypothetical protein